jgi:hypothetical protein
MPPRVATRYLRWTGAHCSRPPIGKKYRNGWRHLVQLPAVAVLILRQKGGGGKSEACVTETPEKTGGVYSVCQFESPIHATGVVGCGIIFDVYQLELFLVHLWRAS